MKQIEILNERLENQIEAMLDTVIAIQDIEAKEGPAPFLNKWHETALGMCFMHILIRHLWEKMEGLTQEQRLVIVKETGEASYEHYLNLYGFNARQEVGKK